jgi:hypothetical protein
MSSLDRNASIPNRLTRLLALAVAASLAATSLSLPACAQLNPTAGPGSQHLIITIIEGEGALNNIRQRDAREPIVQVTDENHKPVSGVALLFLIHGNSGATATFGSNSLTFSTTTDAQGIAHAGALHLGTHPGSITISVTASVNGVVAATAVIHQANVITALSSTSSTAASQTAQTVAKHGLLHLSKTALIATGAAATAAAVAVTVVVVTRNNSTSLTLGGSTVGHP